jgi:alcohol dehydrogenase class IV
MERYDELRRFVMPEVVFGPGAVDLVGSCAANLGLNRVLLVTDPGVLSTDWVRRAWESLDREGVEWRIFSDITSNPRSEQIMKGVESYIEGECDGLVAVGGGSPMDSAKGIGIVVSNGGHILDFKGIDKVTVPMPPLICIPTTGGSSADVSQFAIVNDENRGVKVAIISKAIIPDMALVDYHTLSTMDRYLTACTALDALTHAFEAYVSTGSSAISDLYALSAVELISQNLFKALEDDSDRREIMMASLEAGLAFSNASLGAVHAMAHALGGYLDLPHGECNALLLSTVVDRNFHGAPSRYRELARRISIPVDGLSDDEVRVRLVKAINDLRESSGISGGLRARGVTEDQIPLLASNAFDDPCMVTNPVRLEREDLEDLYVRAL